RCDARARSLMTTPTNPERSGPRLRLERVTGQGPASFELGAHDSPITIGRKEGENQLVLKDEQSTVSRRHAEIKPTNEGFRIFDLKSRNGVQVQGRAVPAGGTVLSDGDEIKLGLAVLRARIVAPPAPSPRPPVEEDRTEIESPIPPKRPPSAPSPPVRPQPPPEVPPAQVKPP